MGIRGIRDRYFFVGIIDRAAWDIARDNDRAAGPVRILHGIMTWPQARLDTARARIRIANSRSNRASTASIIYSNGTKVIYFNRYVQRTVRINEYNWPDKQFFKNYFYILKVRSGESDGAPASRSGIHSGANDGTLCGRRSVCPFNPFLELSL